MLLQFDAEAHAYCLDGKRVPSVTQILQPLTDFGGVPQSTLMAAAEFGQHVHAGCDLWNRGELNFLDLDPALRPYIEGWIRFLEEEDVTILDSELRVAHSRLRYAGTLDARVLWKGMPWIVDIKSGLLPPTVGAQTAAYMEAWRDANASALIQRRCCVQLNPEFPRGYKVHVLKDPNDFNVFVSALNCHRFKEKHYGRA